MQEKLSFFSKNIYWSFGLVAIISYGAITSFIYPINRNLPLKEKQAIDKNLEQLDRSIQGEDYETSCREAKSTSKLIIKNLRGLKQLEPYYKWEKIKIVLDSITNKYCNQ